MFSKLYAQEKYVHVFGQAVTPVFLEAILRREAFGHASKQGSFRTVSSSGSGGRTPNLNCKLEGQEKSDIANSSYKFGLWEEVT